MPWHFCLNYSLSYYISSTLQVLSFLIFLLLLPSIFHKVDAFATEVTVFVISRSVVLSASSLFGRCACSGNDLNIVHLGTFFSSWALPKNLIFFFVCSLLKFVWLSMFSLSQSQRIASLKIFLRSRKFFEPYIVVIHCSKKISTPGFKYDAVISISLFFLFFFIGFLWGKSETQTFF